MVGGNYGLGPFSNHGSCGCWRAVSGSREKCLAGGSDYCVKSVSVYAELEGG